jgi:DNA-binding CsgD family transcriptional regulator
MDRDRHRHLVRLSDGQRACLRAEVARPPEKFGYSGAAWSGELLSRHLRNRHGIELGARQCRRLLRAFGIAPGNRRRNTRPSAGTERFRAVQHQPIDSAVSAGSPITKAGRQDLVLRKIRRVASAGLPLYPFVLTLFDLIAEAIPAGDLPQAMLTDPASNLSWIFANFDHAKWLPVLANQIAGCKPSSWPGLRPRDQLDLTRRVLTLQEFTAPDYRRSPIYNEFFHPLRLEQGVLIQLAEQCEPVGYYPLYRSSAMKPFDRDDLRFLAAAAPHIAHGLQAAKLVEADFSSEAPAGSPDEHRLVDTPGMVVVDRCGRVLGLDQRARSLFFQIGLHDGLQASAFDETDLKSLLDYVARTLRAIFDDRERSSAEMGPPAARIFSHKAGIALRLRGHVMDGERGPGLFVVLVEQIELEHLLRLRLMYRHGLAPREAEMLVLLRQGSAVARIARELGISTATAKTYVRHLIEKLGVPNLKALRACC